MDTERGKNDTVRASSGCVECGAPTTGKVSCGSYDGKTRGQPICDRCACSACKRAPSCLGCETLRSLLRLALGKLRDVQRADLAGTINSLEIALDEARP